MRLKKGSNGFYRAKHCSSLEEVPACWGGVPTTTTTRFHTT
jgi:hypothetical protein